MLSTIESRWRIHSRPFRQFWPCCCQFIAKWPEPSEHDHAAHAARLMMHGSFAEAVERLGKLLWDGVTPELLAAAARVLRNENKTLKFTWKPRHRKPIKAPKPDLEQLATDLTDGSKAERALSSLICLMSKGPTTCSEWRLTAVRSRRGRPKGAPVGMGAFDAQLKQLIEENVKTEAMVETIKLPRSTVYDRVAKMRNRTGSLPRNARITNAARCG